MTSFALALGSGMIAFGPLVGLFSSIVYAKAQLVIVVTSSAFFFLMSAVVASFFWWSFHLIGLRGPLAAIIPGILSQFAFRCWFVSVYHRVEKAIQLSVQQHEAQDDTTHQRPPTTSGSREEESGALGDGTGVDTNTDQRSVKSWTQVAKLRLELNDAACGIAAGVGFGGMHTIMLYGTLLASEMTKNVGVLYQESCPGMPSLVVSAIYALCFSMLDVFFMLFTFFGMRRRLMFRRGERPPQHLLIANRPGAWLGNTREGGNMALLSVLGIHVAASVLTTADFFDYGCMVSLPASGALVLVVAYWFWAGVALIYMPAPTSETSSAANGNDPNHYNSHDN